MSAHAKGAALDPGAPKPVRFNAFAMNTVGHQSPGLWTHPRDESHRSPIRTTGSSRRASSSQ